MANLFAFCRQANQPIIKRVSVTGPVQAKIGGIFQGQEAAFLEGVSEEVDFGGDWKPDDDEILVIDAPDEAQLLVAAVSGNAMSYPSIDANNFLSESIKALFIAVEDGVNNRILIQKFSAQQILNSTKFCLMLDGNIFKELTEKAFSLDNYITAIIDGNKLKFKSFFMVKRIFQLNSFYIAATDDELDTFCAHDSLQVANADAFKTLADENIRKMVHAIKRTNVLHNCSVDEISEKATALGLDISVEGGKIVIPSDKKRIKELLRFLDDGIFEAPLTSKKYITNSKRPFGV